MPSQIISDGHHIISSPSIEQAVPLWLSHAALGAAGCERHLLLNIGITTTDH